MGTNAQIHGNSGNFLERRWLKILLIYRPTNLRKKCSIKQDKLA